jgi:glutathione S-transferase
MPLLLVGAEGGSGIDMYPIVESDPIARYLCDKYVGVGPSLKPEHAMQRTLGEQLVRVMDMYIGPLQVGYCVKDGIGCCGK